MNKSESYSRFQWIIIAISLLLLTTPHLCALFGVEGPLPAAGMITVCTMAGGLLLWLFVDYSWPSLLVLMSLALIPDYGIGTVFASALGSSTIFYLLLCFALAVSLKKTGVAKRVAVLLITAKFSRRGPWYTVIMIFVAIFLLSSCLSSSSTFVIFLPILDEIFGMLQMKKGERDVFPTLMLCSLAVVTQFAQSGSPISHTIVVLGLDSYTAYTGDTIDFATYCTVALPVALLCSVVWFLICRLIYRPDISCLAHLDHENLRASLGPMTTREKIAGGLYLSCVILWVLPGVSHILFPAAYPLLSKIDSCYPPIIALVLLHLLRIDKAPVVPIKDALAGVPWNTLLFAGTLLALNDCIGNPEFGVADFLTGTLVPLFQGLPPMGLVLLMIALTLVVTNFISNAVTIAMAMAIAIPLCTAADPSLVGPMSLLLTSTVNFSFATSTAIPAMPLVLDSGWVTPKELLLRTTPAILGSILVTWVVGIPLCRWLL